MPHRDSACHIAPHSSAQHLVDALKHTLGGADFSGCRFRAANSFTPWGLVVAAVLWAWSDRPTLMERYEHAAGLARLLLGDHVRRRVSYQAFGKLLIRWTDRLLPGVIMRLRHRMETRLNASFRVGGYILFGVDGTKLELPRTVSHERRYCPRSLASKRPTRRRSRRRRQSEAARMKKAQRPQMWLTMLWHVGSGLPWDWRLGPSDSSERGHLGEMLGSLPAGSLFAADAGFQGYAHWLAVLAAGHDFVIRVGSNVKLLKKLGYVRESAGTVYLWPDAERKRQGPPLILRHVVVHNGRSPCHLVTSILNRRELSDRDVAEVYRRRWGIEVYYRHFKQTFGRRKLRSHEAEHARCEAIWSLVGLWAMLLYPAICLDRQGLSPRKMSVAAVLRAYHAAMRSPDSRPEPAETLTARLGRALTDDYVRRSKQSRDYPQKKNEPPPGPPRILKAAQEQRQTAQQIRNTLQRLTA